MFYAYNLLNQIVLHFMRHFTISPEIDSILLVTIGGHIFEINAHIQRRNMATDNWLRILNGLIEYMILRLKPN